MKTRVLMKRELFGLEIKQQSDTGMLCLTDLNNAGRHYRAINNLKPFNLPAYLNSVAFLEFKEELERRYGVVYVAARGRYGLSWAHPLIFIDIALAIDPKLKIEVYKWMFDNLIKFRNDSGDSYKEMVAAIYMNHSNKADFPKYIVRVANYIRKMSGVEDWQQATEEQLKLRDDMHNNIRKFCKVLRNPDQAVLHGVNEALADFNRQNKQLNLKL